jgi:hypothetical protein
VTRAPRFPRLLPTAAALGAAALLVRPAAAQTSVSLGLRADRSGGAAVTSIIADGIPLQFRPNAAEALEGEVAHVVGRARLAVRGAYFRSGLAGVGDGTVIEPGPDWSVRELGLEAAVALVGGTMGSGVRLAGGPRLGWWKLAGDPRRTTLGANAALEMESAIGGRFGLVARGELAHVGKPLKQEDVPGDTIGSVWRRSLALAVRARL